MFLSYPDGDPKYSQLDQTEIPDPTESHSQTHHLPMTCPTFKLKVLVSYQLALDLESRTELGTTTDMIINRVILGLWFCAE